MFFLPNLATLGNYLVGTACTIYYQQQAMGKLDGNTWKT